MLSLMLLLLACLPLPYLLTPRPLTVPRKMRDISGLRLGMQAEMTPMLGSAADQMAALTKSQVTSALVRRPRTVRRMMLMMQTLEGRGKSFLCTG